MKFDVSAGPTSPSFRHRKFNEMPFRSSNILLYLNTVRYLRPLQIFHQMLHRTRQFIKPRPRLQQSSQIVPSSNLLLLEGIPSIKSLENNTFTFLNRSHAFGKDIDWDFNDYGKLWCYNLNYFSFLNQPNMERETGLSLIHDFISKLGNIIVGLDPYPTSLRIINWLKFIARHGLQDDCINNSLCAQARHLSKNLEFHILGNHLLENAFALFFAAFHSADEKLFKAAKELLIRELGEQVLPDGGHFELSPMYHQIILERLLDSINLMRNNDTFGKEFLDFLSGTAAIMLGWLRQMTFRNGAVPLFNDAAYGIAPTSGELFSYAERLGVLEKTIPLCESGYRRMDQGEAELIFDGGHIGPDYIPGHAHADTLNFEFALFGVRVIVDSGVSTYANGPDRLYQRSTAAHNTVAVDDENSSEVWHSFRVARRARPFDLRIWNENTASYLSCAHDGYRRLAGKPVHRRLMRLTGDRLTIRDAVEGRFGAAVARYHFSPAVNVESDSGNHHYRITLPGGQHIRCIVTRGSSRLSSSTYYPEFGITRRNICLEVILIDSEGETTFSWA